MNFHSLSVKACFDELKSSARGLSAREAAARLKKNGPNRLQEAKPFSRIKLFFKQFQSPFIYILLLAGAAAFFLGEMANAGVIFGAVILNSFIGFLQEGKAHDTLAKLRAMVEHKAFVWRDNEEVLVDAGEIVVGDIFLIEAGSRIPADGRLIEASELSLNEAVLTGESFPSEKNLEKIPVGAVLADRHNMVYTGTVVASGRGRAVVTAVGQDTEIGKISSLIAAAEEGETPLQERLANFSKFLAVIFLSLCLLIMIFGLWQGRGFFEMFLVAVALAVSSIPEGLLISMTFILALGMQRLLKNKVLTRKMVAAETLGSTTVICSDKTGTLTEGLMSVSHIIIGEREFELSSPGSRQEGEEAKYVSLALQIGAMCNNSLVENPDEPLSEWRLSGSSTERALLLAAYSAGLDKKKLLKDEPLIAEKQFTSSTKFMATAHRRGGDLVVYEKGAPEIILGKSSYFYHQGAEADLTAEHKEKILKNFENLTKRGFRVLAVAWKKIGSGLSKEGIVWPEVDRDLVFVGLVALRDPLRPDARQTIEEARRAGVRPVIITGDHKLTALAIGEEIGLAVGPEDILTGDELDKMDDKELFKRVGKISIYARVNPHHKLRIVNALRSRGEVVAMAGDGVNDAPALQAADIGIALGNGTDVAKEASDMVLLDNNFKVIVLAVEEGRRIFANLRKVITYLTSDAFSEIVLITGSIFLSAPLAILPAQILWLNIIHDGLPNFTLAYEKGTSAMMSKKPKGRATQLLSMEMKTIIFGTGIVMNIGILFLFVWMYFVDKIEIDYLRSVIFAVLGVKSLAVLFSLRSLSRPIWRFNPFSNWRLLCAVALSSALLLAALYWPLLQRFLGTTAIGYQSWLLAFAVAGISLAMVEATKLFFIIKRKK